MNNNSFQKIFTFNETKIKKEYEIWKGKNYFLCKGKIYIGSEYYLGFLTNLYIQIYCCLFIIFILIVRIIK